MSDSDQEEKVNQFVGITGADSNRAKFYLQSAAWDLNVKDDDLIILVRLVLLGTSLDW